MAQYVRFLSRLFSQPKNDVEDGDLRAALQQAQEETRCSLFYRASYLSSNHLDPFSLKFLGARGIKRAVTGR